jgi:hypothetical protein
MARCLSIVISTVSAHQQWPWAVSVVTPVWISCNWFLWQPRLTFQPSPPPSPPPILLSLSERECPTPSKRERLLNYQFVTLNVCQLMKLKSSGDVELRL